VLFLESSINKHIGHLFDVLLWYQLIKSGIIVHQCNELKKI